MNTELLSKLKRTAVVAGLALTLVGLVGCSGDHTPSTGTVDAATVAAFQAAIEALTNPPSPEPEPSPEPTETTAP